MQFILLGRRTTGSTQARTLFPYTTRFRSGCGTGKPLISAALSGFKKVYGIELLEGLCKAAKAAIANYMINNKEVIDFKVICGDILKEDWINADVVYISSICFPEELINGIIKKAKGLKNGTRIISVIQWNDKNFKTIYKGNIMMTWGITEIFIMIKD